MKQQNNDWKSRLNIVYSTNPDFTYEITTQATIDTLPPERQKLHVQLERRNRGGKTVTLVSGFVGADNDLKELGKMLKTRCGVGGAAKDGDIIIQGDWVNRVKMLLTELGYNVK